MTLADERKKMVSVHEVLSRDPGPPPPKVLLESSTRSFGTDDIPIERYTSRDFLRMEYERLWSRVWQLACREEDIPNVGDHTVYEIGDRSVLLVRSAPDRIQGFYNACLHRGRRLKDCAGNSAQLNCAFHGWSWELDGRLASIPCRWDFPQVSDEEYRLPEVHVAAWQGSVFVNFDPEAEPLEDFLDVLPAHLEHFSLEDRFTVANVTRVLPINWKAAQEAFLESYHVARTHPNIVEWIADANTQYDVWENVSRFITLAGVPSPHVADGLDDESVYNSAMQYLSKAMGGIEPPPLPEGENPREVLAQFVRQAVTGMLGVDLSQMSISSVWDAIEYSLFPNWCLFVGVLTSYQYRFRPNGNDPDSCIFDIRWLLPVPPDGPRPPAGPPRVLKPEEPFTAAPELMAFADVLEQDMANLPGIQLGMKAAHKKGITLSEYQECRIRHFHSLLDKWMAD